MTHLIIDTNVIIRYLIRDDEKLYKKAAEVFASLDSNNNTAEITESVLAEVVFVLTSVYEIPRNAISQTLSILLSNNEGFIFEQYFLDALRYYSNTNLHIVDLLIMAKAKHTNKSLLSFDKKLMNKFKD